jgi:hypothetical protein
MGTSGGGSGSGDSYAHNKGQEDYKRSGGMASSNPLTELVHPTYDPPSGHEKSYGEGWSNAKSQDSSGGK